MATISIYNKINNRLTIISVLALLFIILDLLFLNLELLQLFNVRKYIFIVAILILVFSCTRYVLLINQDTNLNFKFIKYFRLAYCSTSLFTAIQHFTLIRSGMEPHNIVHGYMKYFPVCLQRLESYYILSILYLITLLFILFNLRTNYCFFIMFILGGLIIPFSLETFLKNIIHFWCMFISKDCWNGKKANKTDVCSIFMIGFCIAIISSFAGFYKSIDPVWLDGMGLYYSLNIPFFVPEYLWFILDFKTGIFYLNWLVIIIEILVLPLYLVKISQRIPIWLILGLGMFLTFIMSNFGLIGGTTIISIVLLLLSLHK